MCLSASLIGENVEDRKVVLVKPQCNPVKRLWFGLRNDGTR